MYNPACQRCPLHKSAATTCVPGSGSLDAKIVVYSESPGISEEQGQPFTGETGKLLDEALSRAKLTRDDLFFTHVVRCRPADGGAPTAAEVRECRVYTAEELATIQPRVVVALGAAPLRALTGLNAVGKARGALQKLATDYRSAAPVIPTYHPAAALHNPANRQMMLDALTADLKMAKVAAFGAEVAQHGPPIEVAPPNEDVFRRLSRCEVIAVDGEWESVGKPSRLDAPWMLKDDGTRPRLVSVGMAGMLEDGTVLATSLPWGQGYDKYEEAARLVGSRVPSVYHFGTADLPWLLDAGFDPHVVGDTFVLAGLLNIEGSLSLDVLAAEYTTMQAWKTLGSEVKGRMPIMKAEWSQLLRYNALDCAATLLLHQRLLEVAHETGRERVLTLYQKVLCPALKTFSAASLRGVRIDVEKLHAGRVALEERIKTVELRIAEMVGMPDRRDVTRGDALAPLVERLLNVQLPRTERTGKPSLAKDNLLQLQGQHEIVDLLLELSWLRKKVNSYFRPWDELMRRQHTDRLRAFFKLTTARTGRTSMEGEEGGTLQQFPRQASAADHPELPAYVSEMRELVIPEEDWVLVLADESQVELRIGATVARERNMIAWYQRGWRKEGKRWVRTGEPMADLHTMTGGWLKASKQGVLLGDYMAEPERWTSTITKAERTGAKIPNFGFLYGGQEAVVIDAALEDYGIRLSWQEAHEMREGYFTLYPDLVTWHQVDGPRDVSRGYCESLLGRRRDTSTMPGEDFHGMVRKMLNTPVQSLASDLTLAAMVKVDAELTRRGLQDVAHVIGFVHDSVMVECRKEVVELISEILRDAMEDPMLEELGLDLPVPLMADVEVGHSWGSAK